MSIFYFKVNNELNKYFKSYYLNCYDKNMLLSRLVNYDAYHLELEYIKII